MDKLILIDGNSLLNRAFYAMNVFSTKDGLPTNGIFGFVKLLFKVIEDERPEYLAVAFDVHQPTFRHKMYGGYKGTRRPMPEELVRQVPVLKELLKSMDIRTVELGGYEADDLIGTLSRAFEGVQTLIYTGDRDAYQLVNEHVSVCFTKRGVSDLDRLTAENFFEKEGITPAQIIEQKSLMGDSSDNIPGVRGVGPKTALDLLKEYGTLENIYAHLDDMPLKLREKLEASREDAFLSHTLATIDLNVPLDVSLESCRLNLPFSEEARAFFSKLEFRSLVNSANFPAERKQAIRIVEVQHVEDILPVAREASRFAFCIEQNTCHLYIDGTEYIMTLRENFLVPGFFFEELKPLFEELFTKDKTAIVPDIKELCHHMADVGISVSCHAEDVTLLRYLGDSNLRPASAATFAGDYALPATHCAYALDRAYEDAQKRTRGTEEERLYRELELPLAHILYDMERTGVCVDTDKFPEFSDKFNRELENLSTKIYSIAGGAFNLNSPFQLSDILFEKLALPSMGAKRNSRGGYSTNAEVLERLAEEHEIARHILRYREVQKLLSTYIDGIRPLISHGLVHTTYNQTMTTTGRLSSANPNLQNIPIRKEEGRELRKLFVARPGNILIDADYSQIELRLLAHFSGCKPLIEAYNAGEDIHVATAAQVFGVARKDVTSLMRRRAKTINFGIIYGMSAFGLAKDLGCSATEAQNYIDLYFKTYSDVREYMDGNVRRAKEDGFVTTILGRKRYIPELKSPNYNTRSFGERAAMNMPLQGSSADIIKLAMLGVARRLKEEGLTTKMVLQVHDELILDAPEDEKERAAKVLKEEMERAIQLRVPLIAEVSMGKSWYDAK